MVTKKQHFVFQSYLSGFSIEHPDTDKFIWVYDKKHGDGSPPKVRKSVKSICYDIFYYSQKPEGDDILEKCFQKIEDEVSPIIKNLDSNSKKIELSDKDKSALAYIIGLSMARTPSFRDPIELFHKKIAESVLEFSAITGPNGESFEEYSKLIGGIEVSVEKWVSLKPMLDFAYQLADSILKKTWQFYRATDEHSFITSDNPVLHSYDASKFGANAPIGPCHPLSDIVFPLRKDLALVCTHYNYKHMEVLKNSSHNVRKFNRGIARAARRYIVSDQQSIGLARLVEKYKDNEQTVLVD